LTSASIRGIESYFGDGTGRLEANMPGDPKECREHARCCAKLAKEAARQDSQQTFLRLERSWLRLAVELEDAQRFLTTLESLDFNGFDVTQPDDASPKPVAPR
jgi:hypothetical protein